MHRSMRAITVYEMHVFKDVENTSWSNPQVHTFPLTDSAAAPFTRDKGNKSGIKSLRRCSASQLAFLSSHLKAQNAILKSARDEEKKAQKARELRQKQEAQKEEEKRLEEIKKWHQSIEEKAKEEREGEKNDSTDNSGNTEDQDRQPRYGFPPNGIRPPFPPFRPPGSYPVQPCNPHRARESVSPLFNQAPYSPAYNHPVPPPPPPPFYNRAPHPRYPLHETPTPLEQESDWSIECVELDLVPVVSKVNVKKPKTATPLANGQRHSSHVRNFPRPGRMRGPAISYQLAESANTEFAVLYSRVVMTHVPEPIHTIRPHADRVYYSDSYDGGSVYDYDSERDDTVVDEDEDEEGDKDEDKEEEEDLEIVEGFKHCHPVTESMSKCCLEK